MRSERYASAGGSVWPLPRMSGGVSRPFASAGAWPLAYACFARRNGRGRWRRMKPSYASIIVSKFGTIASVPRPVAFWTSFGLRMR